MHLMRTSGLVEVGACEINRLRRSTTIDFYPWNSILAISMLSMRLSALVSMRLIKPASTSRSQSDCAQIGNGDSVVALFRRQIALWPVIGHLDKTGCRSSEYLDFPQSRIAKFSPATLHVFDMEFYILRLNAFEIFSGQEPRRLPEWSARNRSTNKAPGGRLPESFRASGT